METMKKKITLIVVLVISHLLFFFGGVARGRHTILNYMSSETERADAVVTLGQYSIYRDIAENIKTRKYDNAKCSADLGASSTFDDIKACIANQTCRNSIEEKVREIAPEALDGSTLKFDYLESKNGIRRCNEQPR
jgi:hypothetical protein